MSARSLALRIALTAAAIAVAAGCTPVVTPTATPTSAQPTASPTPLPTVALPSPTATPTASPSPSPSPTGATGTPPPPACPVQSGGDPSAQAQLTAIRIAHQPGFDRVVFEFGATTIGPYGLPPYEASVVKEFVGGGSGRPVPVDGNAFLQIRFRNASTVDPSTGKQTITQTDIHPALPLVRNVKLIDDFERVMTWGIGLERLACAKITALTGPVRLVVDLPTPP